MRDTLHNVKRFFYFRQKKAPQCEAKGVTLKETSKTRWFLLGNLECLESPLGCTYQDG